MSKPLRFDAEAEDELRAAAAWYERQRRGRGGELLAAVADALVAVQEAPAAAPPAPLVPGELGVRRRLTRRFPYAVVFVELPDEIRVVAVAHGRRRPGYWRGRLGG